MIIHILSLIIRLSPPILWFYIIFQIYDSIFILYKYIYNIKLIIVSFKNRVKIGILEFKVFLLMNLVKDHDLGFVNVVMVVVVPPVVILH
jgi:hypothetical protein